MLSEPTPPDFSLDGQGVVDPEARAVFDEGAMFGVADDVPPRDERVEPHVIVAWLDEPPGTSLADVVYEDLARMLSRPGSVLLDREPTFLGDVECVRTFTLDVGETGVATASEQWRLLAAGRRWTVTATTALGDQPSWGPRLAAVAASFRAR
jgi:hypothetical protein